MSSIPPERPGPQGRFPKQHHQAPAFGLWPAAGRAEVRTTQSVAVRIIGGTWRTTGRRGRRCQTRKPAEILHRANEATGENGPFPSRTPTPAGRADRRRIGRHGGTPLVRGPGPSDENGISSHGNSGRWIFEEMIGGSEPADCSSRS